MEALTRIVIEAGKSLCGILFSNVTIIVKFQSNLQKLEKCMKRLENLKNSINEELESAHKEGRQPTVHAKEWLKDVEEIHLQVNLLMEEVSANEKDRHWCCLNCAMRYRLSKKAARMRVEIKEFMNKGDFPTGLVAASYCVKAVEEIPAQQIMGQKMAEEMLIRVMDLLEDERVGMVGIWGMGGVGKTTLVKNLNNRLESYSLAKPFDIIIWVTVSKDLDIRRVQSQIAKRLNFMVNESDGIQERSVRLFARLKKEKKFLLILDDVWEKIDLDERAAMEALARIVFEAGKSLCGFLFSNVTIIVKFQSNLQKLDKCMKRLENLKNTINEELESAHKEGRQPTVQAKEWLKDVEEIHLQVNLLMEEVSANEKDHCCLNCGMRYRLSKKAARMYVEIKELANKGDFPTGLVAASYCVKGVEEIPVQLIMGQKMAKEMLIRVMDLLEDEGVGMVGIWGMGGVGKTTLVKNLNNKLESSSLTKPFDIIIWVTVSKDLDIKIVQSQIAKRLNFMMNETDSVQERAVRLYARLKEEKKYLLILDDVWEKIDLDDVGIPHGEEAHTGSKIILTTRSFDVCRMMKTDEQIKLEVLADEEAWRLFQRNAGNVVDLDGIRDLARDVARECSGLPLAIITVGKAMRGKTRTELWKDSLSELRRSAPYIRGIEKEVFVPLKWSYDSLEGMNIKPCFLYCSLFPEDFSIEVSDLIQHWMAEGLIDEEKNLEESSNRGIALSESLKDSCMLEDGEHDGTVKMHDVVRDVAIWIASSMEDGSKFFVQPCMGLTQITEEGMWESSTKRVSLIKNRIKRLPDRLLGCSKLSTFLLQGNPLKEIPEGSFVGFQALRMLNLSSTHIRSLPLSLLELRELRALLLRNCSSLAKLPPLGELKKLQVLDLGGTQIIELTREIGGLTKLRQLNLSRALNLESIQAGTISGLSSLEVLDMSSSAYKWDLRGKVDEGRATVEELESLWHLSGLYIRLDTIACLALNLNWLKSLRRYHICIGPRSYHSEYPPIQHDERRVTLAGVDLSGEKTEKLCSNVSTLVMTRCKGISGMSDLATMRSMDALVNLKSLSIELCDGITNLIKGNGCENILPNLEQLNLVRLINLVSIWEGMAPNGGSLRKLRTINVRGCRKLWSLISYDVLPQLENLEVIKVSDCPDMTTIITALDKNELEVTEAKVFDVNALPKRSYGFLNLKACHVC